MKINIDKIADIQLGYQFRRKLEPASDGKYAVVQIRDFDKDFKLSTENLSRVNLDKPAGAYLLNKGDVLFLSRGHKNWATTIPDNIINTITVSHFFVLKIKTTEVMAEYLAWYINQSQAQEYLHSIARHGTHMPLIPMGSFKDLPIEVPGLEDQLRIVELSRLMDREKQLLGDLLQKRIILINTICLNATKGKKEKLL